jgi:hypothetical protein
MMKRSAVLALVMMLACTTAQQQPSAATTPSGQEARGFKNLQVFPKDIPRDQLIAAMKGFTRALGVRCNHCHVVTATTPKEEFDFPADTKEEKRNARLMIRMTREINRAWIARLDPKAAAEPRVVCWTCHRGKPEPESPPRPEEPPPHP